MGKILLSFGFKPVPLKVVPKQKTTAREKFDQLTKYLSKKNVPHRQYHFRTIIDDNELVLFDGLGNELLRDILSVEGERRLRKFASNLFLAADSRKAIGGFTWN